MTTQITAPSTSAELRARAEQILARNAISGPSPTDTDFRRAEIFTNLAKAAAITELAAAITAAA
ncbi:hypothetical protein [Streptomyces californicus]|uniref:hypothetical protein n=1 Tax=Streptomyces californicus TaxID=67351 RepID=UPI0004C0D24A|nr:hypothetical protein [Streptomyces californicus]QRV59346.1 hypothetical protein I6J40_34360 [Streptomyces californicus]